jgi:flagellar biosynthetic protein FlhB
MAAALVAFAAVALLDLVWVRFRHLRGLRMSRQEVKEELREAEGDPVLRARRRQLREQHGRRRIAGRCANGGGRGHQPDATTLSRSAIPVATPRRSCWPRAWMRWRRGIRAAAEGAGVPLVSNPPLARALHRLELGAEIPAEHYQAVAEIIAFVWRRAGRAGRA